MDYVHPYPGLPPTFYQQATGFSPPLGLCPPLTFTPLAAQSGDSVFELITEMNNRLRTIECSVSKIPSFEKELSVLKVHISNANENHDRITKTLTEFDTSIKYVCELSDDLYSSRVKWNPKLNN